MITYDDMKDAKDVLTAGEYSTVFRRLTEGMDLEKAYETHRHLSSDLKRNEIALARKSVFEERARLKKEVDEITASLEKLCLPYWSLIKKHNLFAFERDRQIATLEREFNSDEGWIDVFIPSAESQQKETLEEYLKA